MCLIRLNIVDQSGQIHIVLIDVLNPFIFFDHFTTVFVLVLFLCHTQSVQIITLVEHYKVIV